jgi:Xaa-Pro aminopeptidase/Xaa-Pro dipeptidase
MDRARKDARKSEVIPTERGSSMIETLLSHLDENAVCTDCTNIDTFERIRKKIRKLVYSVEPFYQSRKVKDSTEIRVIAQAAGILDKLFAVCEKRIADGITERQLQAKLLYEAMTMGAYPPSYRYTLSPLIVASGINSSLPHAEPTDRRIRKGDLVTVDLTLRFKGYVADSTRTFAVDGVNVKMRKVYDIVKEAQEAGLDAVRHGVKCGDVDRACRSLIERKGYGKYFIHSTGHGIGLEVHEPPWLRMKSDELLEKNMAVTVEPGIYIPKKFGVRIEDSLIVDKKPRVLNRHTKELVVL